MKIQQDQQALLTGALPASNATPNTGAFTETGSNPFPSQKLAYDALQAVADKIATDLDSKIDGLAPVLLYDQTEINSLVNYNALVLVLTDLGNQVAELGKEFSILDQQAQEFLTPPPPAAPKTKEFAPLIIPGLALAGLKTASDLIGMFRTNTSIAYSSLTSDDAALTAAVAAKLATKGRAIYQPAVMPLGVIPKTDDGAAVDRSSSYFMNELTTVQSSLTSLQYQTNVDLGKVQQTSDASRTAERDQIVKVLTAFMTSISGVATSLGALQTALLAVATTGSTTMMAILRAEKLMQVARTPNAAILLVKTSVLGGSVVTRTNLFSGGHLLYTGGAIANYTLFDATTGAIKASGIEAVESKSDERHY